MAVVHESGQFKLKNEDVCREHVSNIQITSEDMEIEDFSIIKFKGSCEVKKIGEEGSSQQSPAYFSGEAKYDDGKIILKDAINIKLR